MGRTKRALLCSAAGIFAAAGAQAADLPLKAMPVEYVKVCSLYGAGFWYVPGTDTCIKIGAYVKLQTEFNGNNGVNMFGVANGGTWDPGGAANRTTNQFTYNQRGVVSFDMRTQTEYGTLRSYLDLGEQVSSADNIGGNTGTTQNAAATLFTDRAFIQFAGFTAGRMRSFFDLVFLGAYTFAGQRFGADTAPTGIDGIAYTWQFGGGLSASISLEDNNLGSGARGKSTANLSIPNTFGVGTLNYDNKGNQFFDPVFNLRLDQAWGFVGLSAALHDASGGYYGTSSTLVETSGHPGDAWGWAISPGFAINNAFGLQGDTIAAQAVYSKGAAGYATPIYGPTAMFSGSKMGLGWLAEGVFTNGSSVDLTTVWSVNAVYEHYWVPQWRTSLYGGMVGVQYDNTAKQAICANLGATNTGIQLAPGASCNPNFSITELGTRTMWNPVPDLDVGVDVVWWHYNTAFNGQTANLLTAVGAKAAGTYTISNMDALSAIFRIQRNFLY